MLPVEERTTPESARRVVLFPAPFAPMRETISPFATVKETSRSACTAP
jgi:hypothetical protein